MANNLKVVKLKNSNLEKKSLQTTYNWFQRLIAKLIMVKLMDKYQFFFKIQYYGGQKLNKYDIVRNSENLLFVVLDIEDDLALIATDKSLYSKPKVFGRLHLMPRKES